MFLANSDVEVAIAAADAVKAATTVQQLRQALAVLLPLRYSLNVKDTAQALGISVWWTSRLRKSFVAAKREAGTQIAKRGGRRNEVFSLADEQRLITPFITQWKGGAVLDVEDVRARIGAVHGQDVARSTIYKILHRHGWHKRARAGVSARS